MWYSIMLRASFSSLKNKIVYPKKESALISFFVPVLIVTVILIAGGVYPFGEECFLRTDMYHQYAPFMSEFREKLQNGGSLLYSFDVGLGVNFLALYAYYLASPLNWFIVLVNREFVIEFIMFMVVLKIGLCGVTMNHYLRSHGAMADTGTSLFAIFYALSGYVCAYYWNIMWLDCIVLFPLVMLGMERLQREKRGGLYTLALGISILSNYYISIMTCMFLCIYFIALQVLYRPASLKEAGASALRFAWYSLLAGGLAAVLLLPEIAAMGYTASADINFPEIFTEYFSVFDMLVRHLPGIETEQALDHWPNIYSGVFVLLAYPLYLMNRRIRPAEKIVYTVLFLFMLMGFSINVLNFIWHGLHYPNSLPARQSYIYIFLVIFMAFRIYQKKRFIRRREIYTAMAIALGFVLLCQHTIGYGEQHIHFAVYYFSLLLLALYGGLLYIFLNKRRMRRAAAFLAFCLVCLEAAANTALTGITTTSRTAYVKDNEEIRALLDGLFPSTDLFRIERISRKTKNDGAWLNFPSVSLFSSLANADCTDFFRKLGCEASTNAYSITGSTPFVNMLFSVRYAVYDSPQTDGEGKKFIESRGDAYLYENNYWLPAGFLLPEGLEENWMLELTDPVLLQNSFCDMLGLPQVLVPNGEAGNVEGEDYAVTITRDGEYYAVIKDPDISSVTVTWPEKRQTLSHVDRGYLIELGDCRRGDTIRMRSETKGMNMEAEIYRFDYSALKQVYDRLSNGAMELLSWEDGYVRGRISVDEESAGGRGYGRLFFSIPYDSGWKLYIDGNEAKTEKAFGAFLSASVPEGEHMIELRYTPEGLWQGTAVSGISLVLLVLSVSLEKGGRLYMLMKRRRKEEVPESSGMADEVTDKENDEVTDKENIEDSGNESEKEKNGVFGGETG